MEHQKNRLKKIRIELLFRFINVRKSLQTKAISNMAGTGKFKLVMSGLGNNRKPSLIFAMV
jgi:hypothetical protein